jgi:hypothetical protein
MARESRVVAARFGPAYRRITDALDNLGWLPNFVLRVTVGFMFFSGALGKLDDLGKFTAMFVRLGIPAAQVLAPVMAVVELVGGAALMPGLGTHSRLSTNETDRAARADSTIIVCRRTGRAGGGFGCRRCVSRHT